MHLIAALIGATVGALVGAAVWTTVLLTTGYEASVIAILIGFLAGGGAAIGARAHRNAATGGIAVLAAAGAILLGKLSAVHLMTEDHRLTDEEAISWIADVVIQEYAERGRPVPDLPHDFVGYMESDYPPHIWVEAKQRWNAMSERDREAMRDVPDLSNPDVFLSMIADDLALEQINAGVPLEWPEGWTYETAWREAHYPVDIWEDARARWDAFSAEEQQAYREAQLAYLADYHRRYWQENLAEIRRASFLYSFELIDVLWFGLAGVIAFGIGGKAEEAEAA